MNLGLPANTLELILNYIIICFPNFLMTVYVFCKSEEIKLKTAQLVYALISDMLFTGLFVYIRINNITLSHFLRFFMIPILLGFIEKERKHLFRTLAVGLISLSFVSVLEVISVFVQGTIIWITGLALNSAFDYLLSEIIALIFCIVVMNTKRFRRGFQFFSEEKNLGLGLALSEIVMILKCVNLRNNDDGDYIFIVFIIGVIIAGFGLYLWIRRSITAHYRDRQQLRSEEHYMELLAERDKDIERLNKSNEFLAKIVHRDNHLMSNLNASIEMYFSSGDQAYQDDLLRELQTLAGERGELINKEQLESKILPSTGNLLIDSAVNDLYIKAAAHGIDFNLTVSSGADEIIGKYISQTDLQTLLCDHIKDAIIAVESRGEGGGRILVNLSKQNDDFRIDIYDNGAEFALETLSKLGLERVTTHADAGGSGIGFMTTFETLRKAYASLIITEFERKTPFSKSVSFRFDGYGAFLVKSYRKEALEELVDRDDMIIID